MTISANYPTQRPSLLLDFANTKQLDPRITYSRASTGTYYDGKTSVVAEQNLLLQSQDFSNAAWVLYGGSIKTPNSTIAPDGTTTAAALTATASNNYHSIYNRPNLGTVQIPFTNSIYLKAGTYNYATLVSSSSLASSWSAVTVDLSSGLITKTGSGTTSVLTSYSSVSVGNGWYRISMYANPSINDSFRYTFVYIASSSTPTYGASTAQDIWTATGTESIYIWGAQLEQRSSVTAYTPTTTAPITNYIPVMQTAAAGVPRFDNNPTTSESLGLLIEEQRTNLNTYSSDFSNAAWLTDSTATVTSNTIIAPDGTLSGDKLIENTANSAHYINRINANAGGTISIYAKAAERRYLVLTKTGNSVSFGYAIFDLVSGLITATGGGQLNYYVSSNITHVGNGWYRCSLTATAGGNFFYSIGVNPTVSDFLGPVYMGDGVSGLYIWGAQEEAGAFATSYIPTVASQVTRSADAQSSSGLGQIGQGTLYIEATAKSGNTLLTSGATTFTATASTAQKTAVAYNATDTRKSINGAAVTSSAGTQGGTNLSIMPGSTGTVKRIAVYPIKITDTELTGITS